MGRDGRDMTECKKCGKYWAYTTTDIVYGWRMTADKTVCMDCGYEEYSNIKCDDDEEEK